jgi:signal peptidase II
VRVLQATGGAALSTSGSGGAWPARLWLAGLALAVVLLDQLTKQLTVHHLAGEEPVRLLGGGLYLVHVTNSGAAFGLGASYTWVFPLVGAAVLGWIGVLAVRLRSRLWAVSLGLVAGGVVGNLIDRLVREPGPLRGRVVDMLSLFAPDGSVWPVFNLADSALVVGVVMAVWLELTGRHRDGSRATRAAAQVEGA